MICIGLTMGAESISLSIQTAVHAWNLMSKYNKIEKKYIYI